MGKISIKAKRTPKTKIEYFKHGMKLFDTVSTKNVIKIDVKLCVCGFCLLCFVFFKFSGTNLSGVKLWSKKGRVSHGYGVMIVFFFFCLMGDLPAPQVYPNVTQRQLMRRFAVKLILSYEQKCKIR